MPSSILQLKDIPNLANVYTTSAPSPPSTPCYSSNPYYPSKVSLIRHDITTLAVSAIVNAANTYLLGGSGVDGAIHRAAGPGLLRECRTLKGCSTGSAKITSAYDLPCDYVIHAVGPVYGKSGEQTELLQSCYTTALDLLVEKDGRSIAFSCISTGVYGYPSEEAAEEALEAVRKWLDEDEERAGRLERIVFCCFLEKDERIYRRLLPQFFPPAEAAGESVRDLKEENEPDTKKVRLDCGNQN